MVSSSVTLSAARKLSSPFSACGSRWVDGPICNTDELKAWEIDLADMLELIAQVERAAPSTQVAGQWLRRMFYSAPLGGAGAGFDKFLATDPTRAARPMTTADVPQSVLDALVRIGMVRIPGATAPLDLVEISHVFVLLDLRLNGMSPQGQRFNDTTGLLPFILSWLGDIASAWLGFQKPMLAAKKAAGSSWSEPVATPADLAVPLAWLDSGIKARSPIDDLLGDMDAAILADRTMPTSPTPIAQMLSDYYTVGVPSTDIARVDDRFPQWITRINPPIPHIAGNSGISLASDARDWLRSTIHTGILLLLVFARAGTSKWKIATETPGVLNELASPWSARMIDELADRFFTFLQDGLAGRPVSWFAQPAATVDYSGYQWLSGLPSPLAAPVLEINDLEAVAQFYLNWRQPHMPLRTTDRSLRLVRLRDPAGKTAKITAGAAAGTARVEVDPFVDLGEIQPSTGSDHADLLRLDADAARPGKTYRILSTDPALRIVTVEGTPSFANTSSWRVIRRPRLVLIDPFGGRIEGFTASAAGVPPGWVSLDGAPDLNVVRANFDMIALGSDLARPARCYRIITVHPTEPQVQLDATPNLLADSVWRLPAGVADVLNPLAVALTPSADGCDAYDGLLFVAYDNIVQASPFVFTTYSSTVNTTDPVLGSSITGNARYVVRSMRSPDSESRNYEFAVTDPDKIAQDLVAVAGFYQDNVTALRRPPPAGSPATVRVDSDGKVNIRIHIGNSTGAVAGSTGDLVSPTYPALRTLLITLHQAERALLGLAADPGLDAVASATTQAASVTLYNSNVVDDAGWNNRLHCDLLLVRPDLRPFSP